MPSSLSVGLNSSCALAKLECRGHCLLTPHSSLKSWAWTEALSGKQNGLACVELRLTVVVPAEGLVLFRGLESQELGCHHPGIRGRGLFLSFHFFGLLPSEGARQWRGSVPWPGAWTFGLILLPTPIPPVPPQLGASVLSSHT